MDVLRKSCLKGSISMYAAKPSLGTCAEIKYQSKSVTVRAERFVAQEPVHY